MMTIDHLWFDEKTNEYQISYFCSKHRMVYITIEGSQQEWSTDTGVHNSLKQFSCRTLHFLLSRTYSAHFGSQTLERGKNPTTTGAPGLLLISISVARACCLDQIRFHQEETAHQTESWLKPRALCKGLSDNWFFRFHLYQMALYPTNNIKSHFICKGNYLWIFKSWGNLVTSFSISYLLSTDACRLWALPHCPFEDTTGALWTAGGGHNSVVDQMTTEKTSWAT